MKFASQIDAMKISIKGFLPESQSGTPASPVEGQGAHDTAAAKWKVYLQAGWRTLVDERRTITAGTGLSGGGDLSADRSLAVVYGATAGTSTQGNDARLTDSRPPSGAASGDLTGTYPSPTVATGAITHLKVAAANKDGLVDTPSMRTIGPGAQQAMGGDQRVNTIGFNGDLNFVLSYKIINLPAPTDPTDGANKAYVDQRVQGAEWKDSVRLVSLTNITLSGGNTVDGVPVSNGDRVLVAGQTTGSSNGIYVANTAGAWARSTDADANTELSANTAVFVEEGTNYSDTGWTLTTNGAITVGTTSQTWTQFTGVTALIAGDGLTKVGNTVNAVALDGSITVAADSITVGLVPVSKGGTGGTTSQTARVGLSTDFTLRVAVPALTAGTWTTVSLGATQVDITNSGYTARFEDASTLEALVLDYRTSGSNFQVRADVPFAASVLNAIVTGRAV